LEQTIFQSAQRIDQIHKFTMAQQADNSNGNGVTLAGFSGFGSFMQDKSVQTLVAESEGEYMPPHLPVSSDPAEHGFVVSLPSSMARPMHPTSSARAH
jgi:hypothetical protein